MSPSDIGAETKLKTMERTRADADLAKTRKLARDATDVVREEEVGLEFNTGTSIDNGAEDVGVEELD